MLTQKRLKSLLTYNPKSGVFKWVVDRRGTAKAGTVAGRVNSKGYREIGILGERYKAHRLAWLYMKGHWPEGQIDHKDRDKDNNSWDNLRDVDQSTNLMNSGPTKGSASGVKGVHKAGIGWRVSIKGVNFGYFTSLHRASEVARGEYARAT